MIDLSKVKTQVVDISNGVPGYERTMHSNWARKDKKVVIRDFIPTEAITRIK